MTHDTDHDSGLDGDAGSTVAVSVYGELDGEIYAATTVYEPDENGIALPGQPGLWRAAGTAGTIPNEARTISADTYASIVAARETEADQLLAADQDTEAAARAAARASVVALGIPEHLVNALFPGSPTTPAPHAGARQT